ncbi:hypothetical protein BC832DRAFT_305142 [Gaertneriomyces semiglobifer]|nr:hypothetical protein BC832DRAFT_305142 [Gaertneriomyces semiglobifer]
MLLMRIWCSTIWVTLLGTTLADASTADVSADLFAHPSYQVLFGNTYRHADQAANLVSGREILMKTGDADYICRLPTIPENHVSAHGDTVKDVDTPKTRMEAMQKALNLIESNSQCIQYRHGYWTYDFCPMQYVRQYHAVSEREAAALSPAQKRQLDAQDYFLGRHDPSNARSLELVDYRHAGRKNVYVRQRWTDGTICEISGRPREVDIEFHCHPDVVRAYISQVRETATCRYVVVVYSPHLCQVDIFMPDAANSASRVQNIVCDPVGNADASAAAGDISLGAAGDARTSQSLMQALKRADLATSLKDGSSARGASTSTGSTPPTPTAGVKSRPKDMVQTIQDIAQMFLDEARNRDHQKDSASSQRPTADSAGDEEHTEELSKASVRRLASQMTTIMNEFFGDDLDFYIDVYEEEEEDPDDTSSVDSKS